MAEANGNEARGLEEAALRARVERLEAELAAQRAEIDSQRAQMTALAEELRSPRRAKEEVLRPVPRVPMPPPQSRATPAPAFTPVAAKASEPVARFASVPGGFVFDPYRPPPDETAGLPMMVAAGAAGPRESLESRIGSQWFARVGIVALLIGVAWFLKLAYDNHWIHPSATGKTITGLLVGAGVVLWSERFRRKGYGAFSYSLKAIGTGTLYLTLWASFHLYHLLPAPVALLLMVGVTAWNAVMAWSQDAELLAVYALVGGFATPALLSTGGNHETFLFSYVLALDVMVLLLLWKKPWQRLLLGSFPGTVVYFVGWYSHFYRAEAAGVTAVFVVLLAAPFVAVALMGREREGVGEGVLTPLAAAGFLSLAMYSVLQDSGRHAWLPWVAVVLGAVYLLLMRVKREGLAEAMHLTLAIVFLTVAIPLKADGRGIAVGWLAEGVALLWVSARMLGPDVQARVRAVLRWMGCASLALGVAGAFAAGSYARGHAFGNTQFWTQMFAVACLFVSVWVARRAERDEETVLNAPNWEVIATACAVAGHGIAAIAGVRELGRFWWPGDLPDADYRSTMSRVSKATFLLMYGAALVTWVVKKARNDAPMIVLSWMYLSLGVLVMLVSLLWHGGEIHAVWNGRVLLELVGVSALGWSAWIAWHEHLRGGGAKFWETMAAAGLIALNVLVLLAGVREIATAFARSSGWATGEAWLAEAATISGWLMVYAALLLAAGFWKRMAFVRWQGLVLLVFTIAKVFLYDMRSLSSVYRVLSFIGLGVLLMAVSFAYQKDWLGLREDEGEVPK